MFVFHFNEEENKGVVGRLIQKSIDAFIYALDVINRPTIKYRTENFMFNICNAWELLLKAKIIVDYGEDEIYYKGQKDRSIDLSKCVNKVFTDFYNKIKRNLEIIIKLRNKATHFIIPEYDDLYVGVFQANIIYYCDFIKNNFDIEMNTILPSNFLTISTNPKMLESVNVINQVDEATFKEFIKNKKKLIKLSSNDGISVNFDVKLRVVKKDEDLKVKYTSGSGIDVIPINKILDPSSSHPHRQKDIIDKVNTCFKNKILNQYVMKAIIFYKNVKENEDYTYLHKITNTRQYSEKFYNLIVKNIKECPNYIEICLQSFKSKSNPRS